MKYLFEKLKSLTPGLLALAFLVAVTVSSCGTKKASSEDEATEAPQEQVESEANEHPTADEATDEHPSSDEEAPADSTATEDEHPSGE